MKKKDISELQAICSIYSMAYSFNELLDEIHEDLPETIEYYDLRGYLKDFLNDLNKYKYNKEAIFLSSCDDSTD